MTVAALTPTPHGPWRSYAGILLRRRRGLADDRPFPLIGRGTGPVKLQPWWLARYRGLIGLPDEPAVLPPLALQVAAAQLHLEILADPNFPFPALGLVHVGQRVDQTSAVLPGTSLVLDAFTGRSRPVKAGTCFELVTEARRDGRLVWRSITSVLCRHARRGDPSPAGAAPSASLEQGLAGPVPARPAPGEWRRIELIDVPEDLGRRYAAAAADWNPIHQRAWLARRFGFDRAIVHGTWTLARALVAAGLPGHEAFSLQADFRKPVSLPSRIGVWLRTGPSGQALRVMDADGGVEHLSAWLEPALSREP